MQSRFAAALVLACAMVAPALAADIPTLALPTLALDPQPDPSIWSGFHVGASVFGISGGKGVKGGFGGSVEAGYDHEFANNIVLGVEETTGYSPFHFTHSRAHGFDFAETDVKLGYDMGRWMPYVTGGVALLKPDLGTGLNGLNMNDSFNNLINGSSNLRAAGTVGAGVDYAVTNNLHVGVQMSVTRNPNGFPSF